MTYDVLSSQHGKQAVQIVELYIDKCSLIYGTAPCTASIPTTGLDKCFNTAATCQDRANYARATKVLRFSTGRVDGIQQPGDGPTFPTLLSVKSAPTVLTPGKGLGVRSSLNVTIADHPWTDAGVDPYLSGRAYDPSSKGTFWGKFLARNKYYENRRIDVLTGFLNEDGSYDAANFKRRTYIITKISGPSSGGSVNIEAKDPLRLADGEKAKWPKASKATVLTAVNETSTILAISDPDMSISAWYSSGQRYLRCENEIMLATDISGSGTAYPVLTVVRGSMPPWYDFSLNVAYPHDTAASIQPCHLFQNAAVYDVVYFLLHDVAGISPSYLPISEWVSNIEDLGFQYLVFNTLLTDPVDVKKLLTEITELSIMIWWDERRSVVQLRGLRFLQLIGPQLNDSNSIIAESVSASDDPANLTTQNWIYFDLNWPLAVMDQFKNYRVVDVRANLVKESADEYGKPAIRQTKTRWLNRASAGIAVEVGSTMVRQYQEVRKVLSWAMDPKDDSFWVGDTVGVSTRYAQDKYGDPVPRNYLITQVEEMFSNGGVKLKYTAIEMFAFIRAGLISHPSGVAADAIPAPPDYSSASVVQKNKWAYISPNTPSGAPVFSDGLPAYQIV